MRDLINIIKEAEVKPGERKGFSLKVQRLERVLKQLTSYKKNATTLADMNLPDSSMKDLNKLVAKVNKEINKVQKTYDELKAKIETTDTPIKINNFFNGLLKNCSEILAVYKNLNAGETDTADMRFLYRGIRGENNDAIYGKPFLDRKPKDSPFGSDMIFNLAMKEAGFEARRENSSFVSGSDSHAGGYGNLYIMFPVNGFKFTWSKKHDDLVLSSNLVKSNMFDKSIVAKLKKEVNELSDEVKHNLKWDYDLINQGVWSTDTTMHNVIGLKKAVDDGVIPEKFNDLLDQVFKTENIKKVIDSYQLTDTDLSSAILSNHEIYLSGPYYAIKDTNKNRKLLIEFIKSSHLSDKDVPQGVGTVGPKLIPGTVVKILTGDFAGQLGTVSQWKGGTTLLKVTVKSSGIAIPRTEIEVPSNELEVVKNTNELPKGDDLVIVNATNKIGKVSYSFSPTLTNVVLAGTGNIQTFAPHELTKINTTDFNFKPGDKVVIITPNTYSQKWYGKVAELTKVYKHKVKASILNKTGKATPIEIHKQNIVPLDSELVRLVFPKLATTATPQSPNDNSAPKDVYADIISKLQPKIKSGVVTYADIDQVAQNLEYDPNKLIAMLNQKGVDVKPLDLPGNV